jgi:hypothetical protein
MMTRSQLEAHTALPLHHTIHPTHPSHHTQAHFEARSQSKAGSAGLTPGSTLAGNTTHPDVDRVTSPCPAHPTAQVVVNTRKRLQCCPQHQAMCRSRHTARRHSCSAAATRLALCNNSCSNLLYKLCIWPTPMNPLHPSPTSPLHIHPTVLHSRLRISQLPHHTMLLKGHMQAVEGPCNQALRHALAAQLAAAQSAAQRRTHVNCACRPDNTKQMCQPFAAELPAQAISSGRGFVATIQLQLLQLLRLLGQAG